MPLGAFLRRILFYAPGTAEPIGYSPAELVVYEFELAEISADSEFLCFFFSLALTLSGVEKWKERSSATGILRSSGARSVGTHRARHVLDRRRPSKKVSLGLSNNQGTTARRTGRR